MRRATVKWLVLDEFCELSVQIDVVAQSKHACILFYSIGKRKMCRERTIKSTERFDVRVVVFSYGPCKQSVQFTRKTKAEDLLQRKEDRKEK